MSDQAPANNSQTLAIALAVIAVLLAAIIGVMVYNNVQSNQLPAPQATVPATGTGASTGIGGATGGAAPAVDPNFDPKTAARLPKGTTPEQWAKEYYEACQSGDWETAVKRLPADKQASTTPEQLKEQITGYNVTGYKIVSATEEGDKMLVVAEQQTGFGNFTSNWTFVKDGGDWVLQSKAVGGMK